MSFTRIMLIVGALLIVVLRWATLRLSLFYLLVESILWTFSSMQKGGVFRYSLPYKAGFLTPGGKGCECESGGRCFHDR